VLQHSNTRVVLRIPGLGVLKILLRPRMRVGSMFAPTAFAHEFDMAEIAARRGLPVPRPVFVAERRTCGALRRAAILCEYVPDSVSLIEVIRGNCPRPGQPRRARSDLRRLAADLGKLVGSLHAAGGIHGDLGPDNALVTTGGAPRLVLLDWFSAFFLGHRYAATGRAWRAECAAIARHHSAHRRKKAPGVLAGASHAREAEGVRSPAFRKMMRGDLARLMVKLVSCGTPFAALVAALRSYYLARGVPRAQQRQAGEEFAATCREKLRWHIARTIRRADRESRAIGVHRHKGRTVWYRKEQELDVVLETLARPAREDDAGGALECRQRPDALEIWRTACALSSRSLPVRCHVAASVDPKTGGRWVLVERPAMPFGEPDLRERQDILDVSSFVRLLHAFGFRFRACEDDTISRQPALLGPFHFRQGSGYVLDDAGAVSFEPGSPTERSAHLVAAWIGRNWGGKAGALAQAQCAQPIRFGL